MESKVNKVNKIKDYLEFGMKLSVVIKFGQKDEYSLHSHLVGIKEGQFLILDMPPKAVEDLITRRTTNVRVVVRGITDTEYGDIIAFSSEIITVSSRPTWLMYIKLPYDFETKAIRENRRIKVNLPVNLTYDSEEYKATLRDISVSGCGVFLKKPLDIKKDDKVILETNLEHFPGKSIECIIVNFRKYTNDTFLGIRFEPELEMTEGFRHELFDKAILNLN
ncbi:flagellar brake protein [Vibrio sp. JC009]|uniref:PilZ domain-containing protein n=1 Tax=Vibrio sp. JC009 TaxID=2912314 RepID=UPI0023AFC024|nr:PilZ domain-containing protein [Vibrio sp. JC009]WED24225.1 flagellar brake protein [Vibrio sp. JC009]